MIVGEQFNFGARLHIDSWQTIVDCLEEVLDLLCLEPLVNAKNIYEIQQTKSALFAELARQGVNFEEQFIEEVQQQDSQEVTNG